MNVASQRDLAAAPLTADSHDTIGVFGARENNLTGVNVEIPKRRLTVFTGVSGSGKSSLVFDTIAAESQRLINETYSAFIQGFMPTLARPDVDFLKGLTTAITIGQERIGSNPRSTVGTITDANAMLRILFSRIGSPRPSSARALSFNIPSISVASAVTVDQGDGRIEERNFDVAGGMCPRCDGTGSVHDLDPNQLYDAEKSLADGAITIPGYNVGGYNYRVYATSGLLDPNKAIAKYTKKELKTLLHHEPTRLKIGDYNTTYEGLISRVRKSILSKDIEQLQPHVRAFVDRAVQSTTCPACDGTRLNEIARSTVIGNINIADASAMQISDLLQWVGTIQDVSIAPLVKSLTDTLDSFVLIGLGYLSLERASSTLSGGEAQRIKMIRHVSSSLTDVTYIFDEPTSGLHPHDIQRMNAILVKLRDKGNTILVVEHKPEVIDIADHVIDLGPGAGSSGGSVCFQGTVKDLRTSGTVTGNHMEDRAALKAAVRAPSGALQVRGANENNLRKVNVDIPLGVLVAVTGVAGSGKSSLIAGSVATRDDVISIDQGAIKGSRRSNPATYTGLLDPIRKAFAKENNVKPALFSANSEGACPACKGAGVLYTDLAIMAGVATKCDECEGQRFQQSVLQHRFGGCNISEVLAMPVTTAQEFFATGQAKIPAAAAILKRLNSVGLGYVTLGQPLPTLSGGERQRLKLAAQMTGTGGIYVLDEPTTGLHLADVQNLLDMLDGLVDAGRSVIVVEHHQAVMAHADWIIDMGPGAGHEGGSIVFEGTPAALVADQTTLTAKHLASYVGA